MQLHLDASVGAAYHGPTQRSRRMSEAWALQNLYCVACSSNSLQAHAPNRAVEDFHCPRCARQLQVKAKAGKIGKTVINSAYEKKATAIQANRAPDYCFLGYDHKELLVHDAIWVPGHFMTLSVISKKNPVRAEKRRAGWVGSYIHLDRVPREGKIAVVADGAIVPRKQVRMKFAETSFVARLPWQKRGWVTDVLACLDRLDLRRGAQFGNADVYACDAWLAKLHPANKNIRPKIRQQLQVLQVHGIVRRVRPGLYEKL